MAMKAICVALATLLVSTHAPGQWVQSGGPFAGTVRCFQTQGTNLLAGTFGGGVFHSTDNGTSWEPTNFGLTYTDVRSLAAWGTNLFVATGGGIYRSADSGATWIGIDSGLTNANVQAFALIGTNLFAGTGGGVFVSTDSGAFWVQVDSGLTNTNVTALAVIGTSLFAGTSGGVFLSADFGTSWRKTGFQTAVNALAVSGSNLFAGTGSWSAGGSVFRTIDSGATWTKIDSGLSKTPVQTLAVSGANLFAGGSWVGGGGIFLSTDDGNNWNAIDSGLTDRDVTSLGFGATDLFAGTVSGGIWRRPLSEMITSVDSTMGERPHDILLYQNFPNPFNPSTNIAYELAKPSLVTLSVYDMLGRRLSVLVNGRREAGRHELRFDGSGLSSGVYFCRLTADDPSTASGPRATSRGFVQTRKFILLR